MPKRHDPAPMETSELRQTARGNFARWIQALLTRDTNQVARLYTRDATFLPTVSGDFKRGQDGAAEYFHHFLEKNPNGKIVQDAVQALAPDCYLHSGMYNFTVGPADNRQTVEARFSFVWVRTDGEWRIAHHHSSMKPQG